ncbi:MAG: enoyl-CoA hydratase [Acidimicrobiia bacterium]|nr:enoyl-CoA hydratase [Acidimicrobiia bacterium]MYB10456.1 enoyl-CoA hydratase [Acidimicrobiia bacterium]MYE73634.1 enoyl-CoA hydratase [Acidimicrobiia bacterium]MYE73970.1 enoyl-CoA hydratase [Acidimicrobiia bacterium]MYG59362.1 enoyl-CoA hydratase [Acidimicrobiia bacterium]
MSTAFDTIEYSVDEAVATITLNRPEVANAQDTQLIDELDAAFDLAEADDEVRVVVMAANGRHFSAGHDLKALVGDVEPDKWRLMRATPEGKFHHEKTMYFDRCLRIRDFPKPTIAAVHGKCIAAGVMLACMCDLIVASEDASFQNPVLRMTGAAVEILIEPWEMPPRKAKEFLLTAQTISAADAERLGMVNRVVPRDELTAVVHEMAEAIAQVPPATAAVVKRSINKTLEFMGQRDSWDYHFMAHHWMHNTDTALGALDRRMQKSSMKEVFAEHRDG